MNGPSAPATETCAPRILHLVSSDRWTGVAEPVVSLALHQQALGCQVWLACVPSRSFEREAKRRGVRVVTSLYLNRRLNPVHLCKDLRFLRGFVRRERIHVVHCHLINDHWMAAAALRGSRPGVLLARTVHRVHPLRADWFHRRLFASATDLTIAVSREAQRLLSERLGLSPARTRAIYGGVDVARFHPGVDGSRFRRELSIPPAAPLGGIVARMVEGRGHRWLLESYGRAREQVPGLYLAVVGRGPLKKPLRDEIARHPHGNGIIMAGYRSGDLPEAYAAMDFHILLGQGSEGSCRAVLEAMASGKPNIVVRKGALPETVSHGQDGLLVEPDDVEGLAAAMARLAAVREETAAMGRQARRSVEERFREETRARETLAAYADAWKLRSGNPPLAWPCLSVPARTKAEARMAPDRDFD